MGDCIIVCAGDFPREKIVTCSDDFVIAADNGLTCLMRMGIRPDLVIGDYDSLSEEGRMCLEELRRVAPDSVVTLPVEKDDTDTMAAVKAGFARGYQNFRLVAALGGRLDHTIANIQTLAYIKMHGGSACIEGDDCLIQVIRNETVRIAAGPARTFSLFAMEAVIRGVTLRGMQYELEDAEITNDFPIGVSNYIAEHAEASVTVADGMALLILSRPEQEKD